MAPAPQPAAASVRAPPPMDDDDDFSDSDSDAGSSVSVTEVSLGLSDGPIESEDARNPLVSRIGGRPAWLPTKSTPPASVSTCAHCGKPMELLVQIFAPLEGSAYDRVLFVWGCARGACQRKPQGSIRAVRLLQHNHRWAAKLAKQKARADAAAERRKAKAEAAKAREAEQAARQKINPFAAAAAPNAAGGLGGMLFGAPAPAPPSEPVKPDEDAAEVSEDEEEGDSDSDEETSRLAEELAVKASLEATQRTADWASSSTYYEPALYLNTVPEPSASARRAANTKLTPAANDAAKAASKDGVAGTVLDDDAGLKAWAGESYSKMMVSGVDETFERFVARVEPEARQVVRYEMGGTPLPFNASGPVFEQLWPKVKPSHVQATRTGHAPAPSSGGRNYDPSKVPPCPACGGKRTFEVQLMPNLVNLLKPTLIQGAEEADAAHALPATGSADDRRRREIERALGRRLPREPDADGITRSVQPTPQEKEEEERALQGRTGLNFATAMVFVCEKDCCLPREEDGEKNETWREEWVGLQWED